MMDKLFGLLVTLGMAIVVIDWTYSIVRKMRRIDKLQKKERDEMK